MQVGEGFLKPIQESSWWKQAYCNENKYVSTLLSQGKATFGDKQAFYVKLSMFVQAADSKANVRAPFGDKTIFLVETSMSLCFLSPKEVVHH